MIDQYTIQKLRDLSIESVAERVGITVSRHKAICPFHDDTRPSLTFNIRKNTYRCFVCDAHGGPIDLVMHRLRLTFPEACRWLSEGTNVILDHQKPLKPLEAPKPFDANHYARFFEHPFINDAAANFLYDVRCIDPRVVRWCRLNSYRDKNGTNWLQIPYYDIDGRLIGVQARNLNPSPRGDQEGAPRFRFPHGSQCSMYNQQILPMLRPNEQLFITEGCSDCWAMLSAGHKAIAIPSATLLKEQDIEILETWNKKLGTVFHMYPDQDPAGQRLFLQLRDLLEQKFPSLKGRDRERLLIYHQLPEGIKDFGDYWKSINHK